MTKNRCSEANFLKCISQNVDFLLPEVVQFVGPATGACADNVALVREDEIQRLNLFTLWLITSSSPSDVSSSFSLNLCWGSSSFWAVQLFYCLADWHLTIWQEVHQATRLFGNQALWQLGRLATRPFGNQAVWHFTRPSFQAFCNKRKIEEKTTKQQEKKLQKLVIETFFRSFNLSNNFGSGKTTGAAKKSGKKSARFATYKNFRSKNLSPRTRSFVASLSFIA